MERVSVIFGPLLVVLFFQSCASIEWDAASLPANAQLFACEGSSVTLPWTLALRPGDRLLNIIWFFSGRSSGEVAWYNHGVFSVMPYSGRVQIHGDAGLVLHNVTAADAGTFYILVKAQDRNGHSFTLTRQATVYIGEGLMTADGRLTAGQEAPELDPATGQLHSVLTCGDFVYPGNPPFNIVWQTPNGESLNSNSYKDGKFRLKLRNPVVGGSYTCKMIPSPVLRSSAPDSPARLEKNYFKPLYRTEQLVIRRTGNHSMIKHQNPPPFQTFKYFNPIFDKEFLHQVLDLQNQVEGLRAPWGVNGTVGLGDICYQPRAPELTECTIQSVLQYFQNNGTQLDRKVMDAFGFFTLADYLDHLDYCLQAPFTVNDTTALHDSCLGTFGGPVFPWTAMGGYDGNNYRNATELVITFVVRNHVEESENAKAKAWEKVFTKFMKNYSRHHHNITIDFSSGAPAVPYTCLHDGKMSASVTVDAVETRLSLMETQHQLNVNKLQTQNQALKQPRQH